MKNLKELEELQKVAVEITRLCAEYSQRAETESHEDLEPLWNLTYNEAEASERALFSCEKKSYAVIVYSNIYGRVNSYDEQ